MATKTLVVVESPSKAKTINKYLGRNYIVEASVGHIKDLVKFKIGVDIENGYEPKYITIKGKGDVIKRLKKLSKEAKAVMIATDPDREGEAIAWHIAEVVKQGNDNVKRILFNEITKAGVKKGLSQPRDIDTSLFMSQQARRVMDRLIGYKVSPFLSRALLTKTTKALSAGRVQSVALRLICERDSEIKGFMPIPYWSILADFKTDKNDIFSARLVSFDGKSVNVPEGSAKASDPKEQEAINKKLAKLHFLRSAEEAEALKKKIETGEFEISKITKKNVTRRPAAPFTTSSLQQEASRRLGFSNKKTMSVAQRLYEGVNISDKGQEGLITYMRTDSVRLSPEAQAAAAEHITDTYGKNFLPAKPPVYTTKSKNVQDAHEAIRPTSLQYTPEYVKQKLDRDQARLYELIFNRFVASQMAPAKFDQTTVDIQGEDCGFRATGSVMKFKGFLAVYQDIKEEENGDKEENVSLPQGLEEKDPLEIIKPNVKESKTKSKPKYNAASLVKELDELGIGRPSTYASIISTLVDREYITSEKKKFMPTELGIDVNEVLMKYFPNIFNVKFTADMEKSLDNIALGDSQYVDMLDNFYAPFSKSLDHAEKHGDFKDIICEVCGKPMEIKVSRRGRFLGCSNYPDCTNTKPLPKVGQEPKKELVVAEGITCDECGGQMYIRESRYGRFYGCVNYPKCKGTKPFTTNIACPKCHDGTLIERFSPKSKKKFWGCSNYPKCDYITNHEPYKMECPECGHYYMEIRFRKGDDDEWQKYIRCPECKTTIEVKEEEKKK